MFDNEATATVAAYLEGKAEELAARPQMKLAA